MDVDYDAHILSKLGILQSTLQSPKRRQEGRINISNNYVSSSDANSDGNSDDCLFDNGRRLSIKRTKHFRRNKPDAAINYTEMDQVLILCIFFLVMILINFKYLIAFASLDVYKINDRLTYLSSYAIFYGCSFLFGSLFSGSFFCQISLIVTFFIIPTAFIIVFIMMFAFGSVLSNAFFVSFLGLVTSTTLQGALLLPGLMQNRVRYYFYVYLVCCIASLSSSLFLSDNGNLLATINFVASSTDHQPLPEYNHIVKRKAVNLSSLNNFTMDAEDSSKTSVKMNVEDNSNAVGREVISSTSSSQMNIDIQNNRVFKSKTEENRAMRREADRKRKKKEKLEEEQRMLKEAAEEKAVKKDVDTLANFSEDNGLNTDKKVMGNESSVTAYHTTPDHLRQEQESEHKQHIVNTTTAYHLLEHAGKSDRVVVDSVSWSMVITVTMVLVLPMIAVLCVYCFRNQKIKACEQQLDIGVRRSSMSVFMTSGENNETNLDRMYSTEPLFARLLSLLIWVVHFALYDGILFNRLLMMGNCDNYDGGGNERSLNVWSANVFFWCASTAFAVLCVGWSFHRQDIDNRSAETNKSNRGSCFLFIIHVCYLLSMVICFISFSLPRRMDGWRAIIQLLSHGFLVNSVPWMVLIWLSESSNVNPFAMTRRFLTAYALSQLYGALFELRSIVPTQPVDDLEAQLNSMHATSVKLLLASYAFFAILSYINEYERRQRHIVELSEEIMGVSSSMSPKKKKMKAVSSSRKPKISISEAKRVAKSGSAKYISLLPRHENDDDDEILSNYERRTLYHHKSSIDEESDSNDYRGQTFAPDQRLKDGFHVDRSLIDDVDQILMSATKSI